MTEDHLLQRIARTLKEEIGPAIDAEYPKTQAFMAGVVLQKLGQQLGLAGQHRAADNADLDSLITDLNQLGAATAPATLQAAVAALTQMRDKAALCQLIESLYATRPELGDQRFTELLGRVRQTLRASIDRQVEYAA
jgi:hypothetical protein